MKSIKGTGIVITQEDGRPLRSGQLHYWDANWANIIQSEADAYCPDVSFQGETEQFTATFRQNEENSGKELCGISSSLEDPSVRIPEEDLDGFVAALDRLHQLAENKAIPEDNQIFLRELRVPNPLVMPSSWRVVVRNFHRRLLVLWGYETERQDAAILPLTPTSANWPDAAERKDLKELLQARLVGNGIVLSTPLKLLLWGIIAAILLGMLFLFLNMTSPKICKVHNRPLIDGQCPVICEKCHQHLLNGENNAESTFSKRIAELEKQAEAKEQELLEYKRAFAINEKNSQGDLEDARKKLQGALGAQENLRKELQNAKGELAKHLQENKNLKEKLELANNESQGTKQTLAKAQGDLKKAQEEARASNDALERTRKELQDVQKTLAELPPNIPKAPEEEIVVVLRKQLETANQKLIEADRIINEIGQNPNDKTELGIKKNDPTQQLDAKAAQVNEQLPDEKAKADELNKLLADEKAKADELNKQLADEKAKQAGFDKQLADANAKADELNKQLADEKAKQAGFDKQLADANAKVDALNKQLADANAKVDELNKQQADANAKVDALNKQLAD
ncbi:MAG: hypothetical protein IJJ33_18615, partial [Victivallales bacterium]|nr:hypothetical protein [Victivallales bacterium]